MRTLFSALVVSLLLWVPVQAHAVYEAPSDLLRSAENDNSARNFWLDAHGHYEDTYLSAWIKGSLEGRKPETIHANISGTFDLHQDGRTVRTRFTAMITNQTLYLRINGIEGAEDSTAGAGGFSNTIGEWIEIPIPTNRELGTASDFDALFEGAQLGTTPLTVQNISTTSRDVIDAIFNVRHEGFPGGHAYFMELKPNYLAQIMKTLAFASGNAKDVSTFASNAEVDLAQALIDDIVNVQVKIDTDENDVFQYGTLLLSFSFEDIGLMLDSTSMLRTIPVIVRPPEETLYLDVFNEVLDSAQASPESWEDTTPLPLPPSVIQLEPHSPQKAIQRERTRKEEREAPVPERDAREVTVPATDVYEGIPISCDSLPGTAHHNLMVRLGYCR